jgi:hypothetical protein
MFKSHIVKQPLDGGMMRIRAAWSNIPIAMCMRVRVAHDHPAKRPLPRLRGAASLSNKTGDKQLFKVHGSHAFRLAAVCNQATGRSRIILINRQSVPRTAAVAQAWVLSAGSASGTNQMN